MTGSIKDNCELNIWGPFDPGGNHICFVMEIAIYTIYVHSVRDICYCIEKCNVRQVLLQNPLGFNDSKSPLWFG